MNFQEIDKTKTVAEVCEELALKDDFNQYAESSGFKIGFKVGEDDESENELTAEELLKEVEGNPSPLFFKDLRNTKPMDFISYVEYLKGGLS